MTPRLVLRLLAVPLIALYGMARLSNAAHWDLLDDLNLAVHEAGHLLFQPLGDHPMVLGGSLFQLIVPLAFVAYFLARRQRFSAAVVLAWGAASLLNVGHYIGDARAQELPLLGGDDSIHDWWYLLTEWDLLARDRDIAGAVRAVSVLGWIVSAGGALAFARGTDASEGEQPVPRVVSAGGAPPAPPRPPASRD
jgi:hypothetical protein